MRTGEAGLQDMTECMAGKKTTKSCSELSERTKLLISEL